MNSSRRSRRKERAASILEISVSSPKPAVQKRYRKLARKHHPDRGGDPEKFKELHHAKNVLIDSDDGNDDDFDEFDEFDSIPTKVNFHHPISITLDELYTGRVSNIVMSRNVLDDRNNPNSPVHPVREVLRVVVQPGSKHGDVVVFPGMSDEMFGRETGDVVLHLKQLEHESFLLRGSDLLHCFSLDLVDVLFGNDASHHDFSSSSSTLYDLDHLDGRTLRCRMPVPATNFVEVFVIRGEGMPHAVGGGGGGGGSGGGGRGRGDLYLLRTVRFPNSFSTEQKHILQLFSGVGSFDVRGVEAVAASHNIGKGQRHHRKKGTCERGAEPRACTLDEFEDVRNSFPMETLSAQMYMSGMEAQKKNVDSDDAEIQEVEKVEKAEKAEEVEEYERRSVPRRRWSVDDDYGIDDEALGEDDERCDTQ